MEILNKTIEIHDKAVNDATSLNAQELEILKHDLKSMKNKS